MRSHHVRMFGLVAVALMVASSAHAQGRDHDRHREIERRAEIRQSDRFVRDRRGDVYDVYRAGRRVPPGLAKKPGQMPPGQYKKRYGTYEGANVLSEVMRRRGYRVSRVAASGHSRYVYYRLNDGK